MVKTTWNAAFDLKSKGMGVGLIVQDVAGSVLAAMYTSVAFVVDPTVAEAMALWKAISYCLELDFSRLHLEGNALEVVHALQQQDSC